MCVGQNENPSWLFRKKNNTNEKPYSGGVRCFWWSVYPQELEGGGGACASFFVRGRGWDSNSPSGDGTRDHGPFVAVDSVRRENLLVLLLCERPALHGGVQLIAPPVLCILLGKNFGFEERRRGHAGVC